MCLEADEAKESKMDLMGFPQNAHSANAALGRRIVSLETRISQLIGQLEHQQITSNQLQHNHNTVSRASTVLSPKHPSASSLNLSVLVPSSPTSEMATNLIDPTTGEYNVSDLINKYNNEIINIIVFSFQ